MSTKNKHICIFICYNNFEHIVKCFESVKNLPIDFFIIENFSENSGHIEEFFRNQNIKGYVQFEKNITNNAVNVIKKDFSDLFESYEYITFSDCDLLTANSQSLFDEIYKILDYDDVGVCCSSLSMNNLPNVPDSNSWIPHPISFHKDYINTNTGIHFMTMKQKNYKLLDDVNFKDGHMSSIIRNKKLKWVSTKYNNVIHLTWDLYHKGNDYYEYKIKNKSTIWNHSETSNYKIVK
jgi:hypothetical protein